MHTLTPAADQAETIITIPWEQLHDSPLQYRQTYNESTIGEIAASIRDTGRIQQPLVVRLRYPNPLFRDQYNSEDGYEIVFGHTRKRGGMLAGLAGAPCIVRNLNDAQVRAAQAAENIARADVHPIEEAQGFRAMLDNDQITADELATMLGKSRSYVYGRLKLLALCPDVRRAVLAGEIGTEVGLLIARVGNAKMQGKALAKIKAKYYDLEDGGARSFRQIRTLLNEHFTLDLKSAIFDIEDEMLLPSAGHCMRCPKRSGNAPEFDDVVHDKKANAYGRQNTGADVCTDPDCFDEKRKAHLVREAAKLQRTGKVVITGNAARNAMSATGELKGADYIDASKVRDLLKAGKNQGKVPPAVVLVQNPRTGKTVRAVRRADLQASGSQPPTPVASRTSSYDSPAEQAKRAAARAADQQKLAAENAKRRVLFDQVRATMRSTERSAFDLRLVAMAAWAGVQWNDRVVVRDVWGIPERDDDNIEQRLATMDLADVTQFMLDCALAADVQIRDLYYIREKPEAMLAAAAHYGIEPTPTPSTAAPAAKKATAGAGAKPAAGKAKSGAKANPQPNTAAAQPDQNDDGGCAAGPLADAAAAGQLDAFAEAAS